MKTRVSTRIGRGIEASATREDSLHAASCCPTLAAALRWFEHAPGFLAVLSGPDFTFVHANGAFERLVGRDVLIGLPLLDALPDIAGQGLIELLRDVVERGEPYIGRGRELRLRVPDGGFVCRYVDFVYQPMRDAAGVPAGVLVQGSDVSLETISQRGLQHNLTHDPLTGLPNYALFRDRLEQAVLVAAQGRRTLIVAAIDLNGFKRVNACLGHNAGDRILCDIAARLTAATGPGVTVARENGDKFLLLLEADGGSGEATQVQALIAAVAGPVESEGTTLHISCSAGVAAFSADGETADALLYAVDRALLRAKEAGPGMVRTNIEVEDVAELENFQLGAALREALERRELEVHYQPKVDLVSGKVSGVEALVRWSHPVKGAIPPATLISVAEDCGLIGQLGDWVLRTACTQMQAWRGMGYHDLHVAVNLSARQFSMPGLEASVVRALADSGLPPEHLDLELTEGLLMVDVEHAIECMAALRRRGVRLSLDDFGTGYSSLAYLQRFPIDVLKIDKSFLCQVPEAADASAIVQAIITMGHSLGMRVVAEGVEREAQCEFLSRNMCDEIQGYYVSRPVPAAQLGALLAREQVLPPHLLRFHRTRPTLLLVEDDPGMLSSLRVLLRGEDYRILTAASAGEGLEVLAQHPVDVILANQRLPGMTGVEFLRTVQRCYPNTVRIILSGFTPPETAFDALNAGAIDKFLTKPWDDAQLRDHVRKAFLHGAMAGENRLLTLELRSAHQQLTAINRQFEDVLAWQGRQECGAAGLDLVRETPGKGPVPAPSCPGTGW
ncbi:MAG: EAL domain-containing protein [Telluria sp.]